MIEQMFETMMYIFGYILVIIAGLGICILKIGYSRRQGQKIDYHIFKNNIEGKI